MRRVAGGRVERDEPQKRNARPSLAVERYECNTGPVVRPRRRSRLETEVRKPDIGRVSYRATRPSEPDVVPLLVLAARYWFCRAVGVVRDPPAIRRPLRLEVFAIVVTRVPVARRPNRRRRRGYPSRRQRGVAAGSRGELPRCARRGLGYRQRGIL